MKNYYLLLIAVFFVTGMVGQEATPDYVAQGKLVRTTVPVRDMPTAGIPPVRDNTEARIVKNRLRGQLKLDPTGLPLYGETQAQRKKGGITTRIPLENFDGATVTEGGALPPDPTGAAGPNHYFHAFNLGIKIFDKEGNLLSGPISLGDFFGNGVSNGDPIVLYDQLAERFFVSQFEISTNSLLIAVSQTPDPLGAYNIYDFQLDSFPDYPKYTIWPDGYYMTANKTQGSSTYVLERDVILAGGANPQIVGFDLPGIVNNNNTVLSPNPAHLLGPSFTAGTPGQIVYFQDDGWNTSITFDHLKIWQITMDWSNTSNSTISSALEIPTLPFDSVFAPFGTGDVDQPGTSQKLDMIGGVISYMVNYREFDTHNSMTVTFNVDVDGNDTSGIRWIELRNTGPGDPWTIFQEGTYAPDDGLSRFMGSMAMDAIGNIGMGFHVASATEPVGMRYTGRFDGDPLGTMTVAEETIIDGIGVQTNVNRFGDYSHLTMDPDNFTFWFTGEYFSDDNFWVTRIASFSLSTGFQNDVGVSSIVAPSMDGVFTNNETVQIRIRNYGTESQTSIPVQLLVDGNVVANEVFTGTINANEDQIYTFSQTIDLSNPGQTYDIVAQTNLGGDEFMANNSYSQSLQHIFTTDVGVVDILSPTNQEGLGNEEITVRIRNFGNDPQTGFDISYSINGGTPVTETFNTTLNSLEEEVFTFSQLGDFSVIGSYQLVVTTQLANDQDAANDSLDVTITNQECFPSGNCSQGDGIVRFAIGTIDNSSACSTNGFGDFTNLATNLEYDTTVEVTAQSGFGDQLLSVWIDYNDNFVFETSERVIFDFSIEDAGNSYTTDFNIPKDNSLLGKHLLRARVGWANSENSIADACTEFTWGETEDYTVTITDGTLSTVQNDFNSTSVIVYQLENKLYEMLFQPKSDFGDLKVAVFNTLGQKVISNTVNFETNGYQTQLNFEGKPAGTYLVKLYNGNLSTVKRVIVK